MEPRWPGCGKLPAIAGSLARSIMRPGGAGVRERAAGLKEVLARTALASDAVRLRELEDRVETEIDQMVAGVLAEAPASGHSGSRRPSMTPWPKP
jgi:hypothetical protein